jgi:DNA-nicking Smr family endonuclease
VIKKKNLSKEDISTWKQYIKNPTDITNKDKIQQFKNIKINRFKYDLHGFSLVEANKKIRQIILSCVEKKYREILLVTGKGIHSNTDGDTYVSKDLSKLRYSVPEYIKSDLEISKYIESISKADVSNGGEGAIIIKLKIIK